MRYIGIVAPEQFVNGIQIVRQAAENLIFLQPIGHAHLHRAIERQFPLVNAVQNPQRILNDKIAFQQLAAELRAGDFDAFGQRNFLVPREQGNFTHLRQIHAHRIVRPAFGLANGDQQLVLL